MSTLFPFTIWCIKTTLPCLITKPPSQTVWFGGTQTAAEHHQNKKLDQRENIGAILSLTICIASPWISTQPKTLWMLLQRSIWQENFRKINWVWCIFVPCRITNFFSKTSFLADCKRYLFVVVFSSYIIVEVLIKQNKQAKLCNYAFQWSVQKQSPGAVL